jgi:hypothetical protein
VVPADYSGPARICIDGLEPKGSYRGNAVMDFSGMEVTLWSFEAATCRSLNLFADGTLGSSYLLTETRELRRTRWPRLDAREAIC